MAPKTNRTVDASLPVSKKAKTEYDAVVDDCHRMIKNNESHLPAFDRKVTELLKMPPRHPPWWTCLDHLLPPNFDPCDNAPKRRKKSEELREVKIEQEEEEEDDDEEEEDEEEEEEDDEEEMEEEEEDDEEDDDTRNDPNNPSTAEEVDLSSSDPEAE